jgi:hypothetical protein
LDFIRRGKPHTQGKACGCHAADHDLEIPPLLVHTHILNLGAVDAEASSAPPGKG